MYMDFFIFVIHAILYLSIGGDADDEDVDKSG